MFFYLFICHVDEFTKTALEVHNKFRSIHGSNHLMIDEGLQKEAQQYAEDGATKGKLEPSDGEQGENLAMKCSQSEMKADEAVIHW